MRLSEAQTPFNCQTRDRNAKPHNNPEFKIPEEVERMTSEEWFNLSRDDYKRLFKGSAIARRKYELFMKNVTNTKF